MRVTKKMTDMSWGLALAHYATAFASAVAAAGLLFAASRSDSALQRLGRVVTAFGCALEVGLVIGYMSGGKAPWVQDYPAWMITYWGLGLWALGFVLVFFEKRKEKNASA